LFFGPPLPLFLKTVPSAATFYPILSTLRKGRRTRFSRFSHGTFFRIGWMSAMGH